MCPENVNGQIKRHKTNQIVCPKWRKTGWWKLAPWDASTRWPFVFAGEHTLAIWRIGSNRVSAECFDLFLFIQKLLFQLKTIKVAFPLRPGSVICLSINCLMRKVTNNCWFGVIIAIGVLAECVWNNKKMYKPMPKFLGRFSNSGLTTFLDSTTFDLSGAAATLLLPFLAPLTGFLTPGLAGCKWQET